MSAHPHPVEIHLKESEGVLEIRWSDEHESRLSLRYLRGWCPCASCQGHFKPQPRWIENDGPGIRDVQQVGGYAIRPVWSDGHQTGIYSFQYLRSIEEQPPGDGGPTNAETLESA